MKLNRKTFRIAGATLLACALFGFLFASPEPVRFVERPDGTVTVAPRLPWAVLCTELAFVLGIGCLIVSPFLKKATEQKPNKVPENIVAKMPKSQH
jgi:hypothetical protein